MPSYNVFAVSDPIEVQLKDVGSSVDIGMGHMDLLIKPSGSRSGSVKRFLVIGSSNNYNIVVLLKTIHFSQNLVDGAARARMLALSARTAQQTVHLVDEDNAGGVLAGLLKQLADTLGADTYVHLVEVTARAEDEIAAGLRCNCPR